MALSRHQCVVDLGIAKGAGLGDFVFRGLQDEWLGVTRSYYISLFSKFE